MSTIKRLLNRWGYAKLEEFGLLLTPDGRIVTTRPAVLDDGLGARVVGWRDGDLAALELEPWSAPARAQSRSRTIAQQRPASTANRIPDGAASPPPTVPERVIASPPPTAPERVIASPPPTIPERAIASPPPTAPERVAPEQAPVPPALEEHVVATPIVVEPTAEPPEEEDWDWEIAVARARAVVEPIEAPAPPVMPAASSSWLATAPTRTSPPSPTPSTVIPVPQLPATADPAALIRTMVPVRSARSTSTVRPLPARRQLPARR